MFVPCLTALRDKAVISHHRLATEVHHAFETKWLESSATGEELLASSDAGAAADVNDLMGSIWQLRVIPVDRGTVISVALAAGTPMLAVLATQMPLQELATRLLKAVL